LITCVCISSCTMWYMIQHRILTLILPACLLDRRHLKFKLSERHEKCSSVEESNKYQTCNDNDAISHNRGRTHRASVRFLAGMPTHMNDQHVLSFEWLLRSTAAVPQTHKLTPARRHVLLVEVLHTHTHRQVRTAVPYTHKPMLARQ